MPPTAPAPSIAVRLRVLALRAALLSPFVLFGIGIGLALSAGWGLAAGSLLAWFDGSVLAARGVKR